MDAENQSVNSPKVSGPRKAVARPEGWAAHYRQLQEQVEQLEAACASHTGEAGSRDAGREARTQGAALHQLGVQLAKQLHSAFAQLEGIKATFREQPSEVQLRGLEKRLGQFEGSLSGLQRLCTSQLEQLAQKEAAAAFELDAAGRNLHASLEAQAAPAQPASSPAPNPPPPRVAMPRPPCSSAASQQELPAEVRECDEFIQRHGPTGGWHTDDHAEFERILKSCRGIYSHAVQISCEQLGLLHSREDIIRHARWHEELQDLQLRKRQAIQEWRVQRASRHAQLLQQPAEEPQPSGSPSRPGGGGDRAMQRQREQQRMAVLAWKHRQAEHQREQQEREQEQARRRRQQERQGRQQRQQDLASRLAIHKQKKAEEYLQRASAAEQQPSSRLSTPDPEAQRRLAERNQQMLRKREGLVQRRSSQAQEREARLQRLQEQASSAFLGVGRDPGRVLQATAAAQLRQLAITSEERGQAAGGWIRHVQHKATPSWCGRG